jgi:hypothetical protein
LCAWLRFAIDLPSVRARRLLLGLVVATYLLAFPYHPALRSPNELCRLWQARALVDHGTIALDRTIAEHGEVGDLSVVDGVHYPSKAPLLAFAGAPIYGTLKLFGPVSELEQVYWSRLLLTVLPSLLLLFVLRRFLLHWLSPVVADSVVATYALGSMAFNYSQMFVSHQLTAALSFFAFYVAWRTLAERRQRWWWLVSGGLCGAVVATEYTGALGVVSLSIYIAWSVLAAEAGPWKERALELARVGGLCALGAAPFLGGLLVYHQAAFGHPLTTGYQTLADAPFQAWHVGGFYGIGMPDATALLLSLFSPLRGLFTVSPFLLLAFPGLRRLRRESPPLFGATLALLVGNAYFTSSFAYESWGWTAGPRHLTPMLPFLLLPVGFTLERLFAARSVDATLWRGIAIGLCVSSVVVNGTVAFVNYVPDSQSTSFFGLAWPLFRDGYLPPTVLLLLGLPNPTSGLIVLIVLGAIALLIALCLLYAQAREVSVAAAMVLLAHLGLLASVTAHHEADRRNLAFLERAWMQHPP